MEGCCSVTVPAGWVPKSRVVLRLWSGRDRLGRGLPALPVALLHFHVILEECTRKTLYREKSDFHTLNSNGEWNTICTAFTILVHATINYPCRRFSSLNT